LGLAFGSTRGAHKLLACSRDDSLPETGALGFMFLRAGFACFGSEKAAPISSASFCACSFLGFSIFFFLFVARAMRPPE
jgi:hypothetical protein